jgi:thiamine transporter ThiT
MPVALIAVALTAPVFMVWGGLVPPRTAWSTAGLAPGNIVRGAGYAGVILLLITPRIYAPLQRRAWLGASALAAIPIAIMLGNGFVPLRTTLMTLFGEHTLTLVGWVTAYLLSFAALAFASCFTLHLWRHRHEWLTRMTGAAALLGLLSNARITHQFSSRYVFVIVPLLVIAAAPAVRVTRWTPLQMTSAAGISLAALASYYATR